MLNYNAGTAGSPSTIDTASNAASKAQLNTFFHLKKALITARKEQYFMPLASVTNMPKHFGKTMKVFEYVPLLDDRNINNQGIAADGVTTNSGNLYGSSKDVGTINGKLPTLTENGGRVNRVGFTRIQREGSLFKFGFFTEFTQEALDFDTDEDLWDHLARELMNGAVQLTEAVLQRDLLAGAGVKLFAGAATTDATVTGEGAGAALPTYQNLMRLDQTLTDNRTPRQTTVITGSRNIDTKTIAAARVMFIGSELVPTFKGMKDLFNNQAFVPIQQYGDAGTILNGEIGSVDHFRIVQVPEMLHWAGQGANVGTNPGYRASVSTIAGRDGGAATNRYNVYPILVIGDDSFTTIGFQTDGKTVKFSVMTKMPGKETAERHHDPYGETGFSSIKWYYGILIKRPERIAILKCVAPI